MQAGAMNIKLTADVGEFQAQMDRAERSVAGAMGQMAESMRNSDAAFGRLGASLQAATDRIGSALDALKRDAATTSASVRGSLQRMTSGGRLASARDVLDIRSFREIERDIARVEAAFKRLQASGRLSAGELAQAATAQQMAVAKLRTEMTGIGRAATVSAGQTAQAMRMLPAQFTDVATQLAGGQNPFLVLLQQGGQVKDSFGGLRPMFRGLAAAMNPAVVAGGSLAAVLGTAAVAMYQGAAEGDALAKSLALTGNRAGQTAGSLRAMALDVAKATGATIGTTRDAVAAVVAMGTVGAPAVRQVTAAIAAYAKASGQAVDEVAPLFNGVGKDALAWAQQMNEKTNFLTVSIYAQIRALKEQGREQEAAAVAAGALAARLSEQPAQLGAIERALMAGKKLWSEFWDAAMDVGRPDTIEDKLAKAAKAVESKRGALGQDATGAAIVAPFAGKRRGGAAAELSAALDEQARLQEDARLQRRAAAAQAEQAARNKRQVEAAAAADARRQGLGGAASVRREMDKLNRERDALKGTEAAMSDAEYRRFAQEIQSRHSDKSSQAAAQARSALEAARASTAGATGEREIERGMQTLEALRAAGLLSERAYIDKSVSLDMAMLERKRQTIDELIAIEERRPVAAGDPAGGISKQARLVEMRGQRDDLADKWRAAPAAAQAKAQGLDLSDARASAQEWAQLWAAAAAQVQALAQDAAAAQAAMIADPVDRARAVAELGIATSMAEARKLLQAWDEAIAMIEARAATAKARGAADEGLSLQAQAQALRAQRDRYASGQDGAAQQARSGAMLGLLGQDNGQAMQAGLAAGWERTTQAIGGAAQAMVALIERQRMYDAALAAGGLTQEQVADIERRRLADSVQGYGATLAAAKGLFKAGSSGYKAMATAEKAFRVYQLASALAVAARQLGLIGATTAATVGGEAVKVGAVAAGQAGQTAAVGAGEAARNALKIPGVFLSFMSAMGPWGMAAAAAAIALVWRGASGGSGGGGGISEEQRQRANGTGTVLGDKSAQSKSLEKSIEALAEVDTMTMRYSAQMLESLRNIETALGGVAGLIVSGGTLGKLGAGVATGFDRNAIGNATYQHTKAMTDMATLGLLPGIGAALAKPVGNLFGTKTDITAQGLYSGPQTVADIQGNGFNAQNFADVREKDKFLGITLSTKTKTRFEEADAEIARQFGLIIGGFADSLRAAGAPLGMAADEISARVGGFVVDLGKVNLSGLTGEQIQEKLSAVFSAAADNMARTATPGFERFQQIGEGYFQTVVRVATGTEQAGQVLRRLGVSVAGLGAVANATGDIAGELVRASLLLREAGQASGIAELVRVLSGSAQDMADAYAALTDLRTAFAALGMDGAAVGRDLVEGAGGLQALSDGMEAFEEGFLTAAERAGLDAKRMAQQFAVLGVAMPKDAASFKALVQGIDASTAAGRQMLGGVLTLASGFAELQDSLADLGRGVEEEINRIRGLILTDNGTDMAQMQARFAIETAKARAGDQGALDALPQLSKDMLAAAEQQATSKAELTRLQAQTMASLQQTLSMARAAPVAPAQPAPALVQPAAPAAVPYGPGINDGVVFGAAQPGVMPTATGAAPVAPQVAQAAPAPVVAPAVDPYAWFQGSIDNRDALTKPNSGPLETMESFATGGDFGGGVRLVGENGPEIEATGPSRIFNASQTADMLSGGGSGQAAMLDELRGLRAEVAMLRGQTEGARAEAMQGDVTMASYAAKAVRMLERAMPDGDAIATREAEPVA